MAANSYELKIQHYTRRKLTYEKVKEVDLGKRVKALMKDGTVQYVEVWRDRGNEHPRVPFDLGARND